YATDTGQLFIGDGVSAGGVNIGLSAMMPGYVSGRYYFPGATSTNTAALTANTIYAAPIWILQRQSFTKLGVEITTAAGTNGRLGVYKWANGVPTALLLDAGAISTATTGYKELTGLALTLNPGVYGLAFLPDAAVTVRICNNQGFQYFAALVLGASGSNQSSELGVDAPQSFGALPATFPTAGLAYNLNGSIATGLRL
ncbi:MAG TPA: hypothetical protein VGF92_20255, partial [Stellaceae bacterium]